MSDLSLFEVSRITDDSEIARIKKESQPKRKLSPLLLDPEAIKPGIYEFRLGMVGYVFEKTEDGRWFEFEEKR